MVKMAYVAACLMTPMTFWECANAQQPTQKNNTAVASMEAYVSLKGRIEIKITPSKDTYYSYEPIFIDVAMTNIGTKTIPSFKSVLAALAPYSFTASTGPNAYLPSSAYSEDLKRAAEKLRARGAVSTDFFGDPDLKPGETYRERVPLQKYVDLSRPGNLNINISAERFGVKSNTALAVIEPQEFDLEDEHMRYQLSEHLRRKGIKDSYITPKDVKK